MWLQVDCVCVCVCVCVSGPPVMLELTVSGQLELRRGNYVAVEKDMVMLTCSFLADPRPNVTWMRNGTDIRAQTEIRYQTENSYQDLGTIGNYTETLTILSVSNMDEGNYTCLGRNEHGSEMVTADRPLEVIGQSA